ncbi:MAG: hypothetical protein WCQ47_08580 [bacterium]
MKSLSRFKGILFLTFLSASMINLTSCSSNSPARKQTLSEFRGSERDVEDLRRWFVLSDLRKNPSAKASFVLSSNKLKAYVLFKESILASMGLNKANLDKKFYSCPTNSTYCSMCINLKNLALNCSNNIDDSYDSGGAIIADNQNVSVKKVNLVDENISVTKLIFTGMPARLVFNTSSNSSEKKVDTKEHYRFSKDADLDPDVVCKQTTDTVVCNATIATASL